MAQTLLHLLTLLIIIILYASIVWITIKRYNDALEELRQTKNNNPRYSQQEHRICYLIISMLIIGGLSCYFLIGTSWWENIVGDILILAYLYLSSYFTHYVIQISNGLFNEAVPIKVQLRKPWRPE